LIGIGLNQKLIQIRKKEKKKSSGKRRKAKRFFLATIAFSFFLFSLIKLIISK